MNAIGKGGFIGLAVGYVVGVMLMINEEVTLTKYVSYTIYSVLVGFGFYWFNQYREKKQQKKINS